MERYRVFDGTNWRSICGCGYHVRDTSGNWKLVDPDNCDVRYYNEGTWKQINCCYETLLTSCESSAVYCSSTKLLVEVALPVMLNDRVTDVPSCNLLDSYPCEDPVYQANYLTWRVNRDTFLSRQGQNFQATLVGLPAPYVLNYADGQTSIYMPYVCTLKKVNISAWCPASTYPEWTVPDPVTLLSPDDVMPSVYNFTFLPSVTSIGDLPPFGSPGQAIYVVDPTPVAYAWDQSTLSWSTTFYNTYFDPIQIIRMSTFNANYGKKIGLFQAWGVYLYSNNYIPFHLLKKKTIEAPCS